MAIAINAFRKVNPWYWLHKLSDQNIGIYPSSAAPTSGTSGTGAGFLGKGAMVIDVSTGFLYTNTNTKASPTWTAIGSGNVALANGKIFVGNAGGIATGVTPTGDVTLDNTGLTAIGANKVTSAMLATNLVQRASGVISAANIIGTSAGQLGHAQGVILQAAPGANIALQIEAFALYYTFAVAAYTAGGNLTVNWGAGGAALTGLVSAANSVGAASSKAVLFVPLSTAGIPIVSNAALNLVSSVAFTNPGTAAGTIAWELWYRTMAVGF